MPQRPTTQSIDSAAAGFPSGAALAAASKDDFATLVTGLASHASFGNWLERLRLASLAIAALSLFSAPTGLALGMALLWFWFIGSLLSRRLQRIHPAAWLALGFACFCLLQALLNRMPTLDARVSWSTALDWIQLLVFIPVAYALRGNQRLLLRLLLFALLGLVVGTLYRVDWFLLLNEPAAYVATRPGFGFPALAYALYAGTALLGLLVLRRRIWAMGQRAWRWAVLFAWSATTALLAQGIVIVRSRGSWIALCLVGFAALLRSWWLARRDRNRRSVHSILIVIAALALFVWLNGDDFRARLLEERGDIRQLLQGGSLSVNNASSLSLRWHAQVFGLESWLQRPWLGWGPGSSRHLMLESGAPGVLDEDGVVLKHLHNSYLELLSQFGLLGLGFWLSFAAVLVWSVNSARARGDLSPDLASFLLLSLLYLALWSLFNFRMVHQDFRGYWALIAGAALTFALYPSGPTDNGRNEPDSSDRDAA